MYKYKVIFMGLEMTVKGSDVEDVRKRVRLSVSQVCLLWYGLTTAVKRR